MQPWINRVWHKAFSLALSVSSKLGGIEHWFFSPSVTPASSALFHSALSFFKLYHLCCVGKHLHSLLAIIPLRFSDQRSIGSSAQRLPQIRAQFYAKPAGVIEICRGLSDTSKWWCCIGLWEVLKADLKIQRLINVCLRSQFKKQKQPPPRQTKTLNWMDIWGFWGLVGTLTLISVHLKLSVF